MVTEGVVDDFEMVDVDQQHGKLGPVTLGGAHGGGQPLFDVAAVVQPGEGVHAREAVKLVVERGEALPAAGEARSDRDDDQPGDREPDQGDPREGLIGPVD